MKFCVVFALLLVVQIAYGQHFSKIKRGIPPAGPAKAKARQPEWDWIEQKVDHFNPQDLRKWDMRYIYNGQFYEEGGPIFIFLGGEWEISNGYLMTGQMFDMADEHKGYMFYTEHRFYGLSFPLTDLSTASLQYLSLDQALADVAYFIQEKKKSIPGAQDSKVVVVGGSYSATMATWIRKKYPHLVDAALASSAPLRAVDDFWEYFLVVANSIFDVSSPCINMIVEAIRNVEWSLETTDGVEIISSLYNTCDIIDTSEPERSYFFSSLANPFAWLVQYANPGDIARECDVIMGKPGTAVERLASYVADYYDGWCITDYQYYIDWYNTTELALDANRQWTYQTCTEYGFYQTGNQGRPFGDISLDMYIQVCRDLFGLNVDVLNTGIERTNLFYGELQPEVTHVVTVHGTVDPWHALGVLEDINPLAPVIVVNGTSHCADLGSISDYDLPDMRDAKLRVQQLIAEWIKPALRAEH